MPARLPEHGSPVPLCLDGRFTRLPDDAEFDQVFPSRIRAASEIHWTSVAACRQAARWLVTEPGIRVLDIGCGPGKFCAVGAATTEGHFTGVEQRKHLCLTARRMLRHFGIGRVEILHANVTELPFAGFDAFYLFNPFEENVTPGIRIDDEVPVCHDFYSQYTGYVRRQLSQLRLGTRVVTFWGDCDEIPSCYDCVENAFGGQLRHWMKRREGSVVDLDRAVRALPTDLEFAFA